MLQLWKMPSPLQIDHRRIGAEEEVSGNLGYRELHVLP